MSLHTFPFIIICLLLYEYSFSNCATFPFLNLSFSFLQGNLEMKRAVQQLREKALFIMQHGFSRKVIQLRTVEMTDQFLTFHSFCICF